MRYYYYIPYLIKLYKKCAKSLWEERLLWFSPEIVKFDMNYGTRECIYAGPELAPASPDLLRDWVHDDIIVISSLM